MDELLEKLYPCGKGSGCFMGFGGEVQHNTSWHMLVEAASIIRSMDCTCVWADPPGFTPERMCTRCEWLSKYHTELRHE